MTVLDYQDAKLVPKELHLTAVVDPEGYVYTMSGNLQARIPGATVSLTSLDPSTTQMTLWPASEYQQVNPQVTDATGNYSFLVPPGTYGLTVTAPGYVEYDGAQFTVADGNDGVDDNIELQPEHWWSGIFSFFASIF